MVRMYATVEELLQEYKRKVRPGRKSVIEKEHEILRIILEDPAEAGPKTCQARLPDGDVNDRDQYHRVLNVMRNMNVTVPEKRLQLSQKAFELAEEVIRIVNGDMEAFFRYRDQIRELNEEAKADRFFWGERLFKAIMVVLFDIKGDFASIREKAVVQMMGNAYCRFYLNDLTERAGIVMGVTKKKTIKDILDETREAVNQFAGEDEKQEYYKDKDEQIASLEFERDNLRSSLELIQSMFDSLKDDIETAAQEARDNAVCEFFVQLNSSRYGNILDKLLVVEKQLMELRRQSYEIPQEIAPIPIIIKQIVKFIKDIGIQPIRNIGDEFTAGYSDIALMNYSGEPFLDEEEKKRVTVVAPGWKYKDTVISNPHVRERE